MRLLLLLLPFTFCLMPFVPLTAEETFVLLDGTSGNIVLASGHGLEQRRSPCSTFKIALCLMGCDAGVITSSVSPIWDYQEGYDDSLPSWKQAQTPRSWIQTSCVWYSKLLALHLGQEKLSDYLDKFAYGNKDFSGGLTRAWLGSTLAISPLEQVAFIDKLVKEQLPVSLQAQRLTKELLFMEALPESGKLFGKTGWGRVPVQEGEVWQLGWLVGWLETPSGCYPYAYLIEDAQVDLCQRIVRLKHFLGVAGLIINHEEE